MKRFVIFSFLLAFTFSSCKKSFTYPGSTVNEQGQTVLYNGIVLPEQWPPHLEVPLVRKEMPVPYLDRKPCPAIINTGRQLFVDDFLIEESNLERVCHHANAYPGNPILDEITYSDGIWYDERENKFKIWYYGHDVNSYGKMTCYAESDDGFHWDTGDKGVIPGTNQVNAYHGDSHIVWFSKEEKDPSKRFKSICTISPVNSGYILQYSADGKHWSQPVAFSDRVQDRSSAFYNAFTKKWVMSQRICALFRRAGQGRTLRLTM